MEKFQWNYVKNKCSSFNSTKVRLSKTAHRSQNFFKTSDQKDKFFVENIQLMLGKLWTFWDRNQHTLHLAPCKFSRVKILIIKFSNICIKIIFCGIKFLFKNVFINKILSYHDINKIFIHSFPFENFSL